jgi:glycosyltransferase involved in cell wall biosynthesis
MRKVLINGYFLCRTLTGIERYAYEITKRLDTLSLPGEISIIVPADIENVPAYTHLDIIRYGKKISHVFWQMFTVQFFLLTHRQYMILDFGNTCLPFAPGIVFLHDIYCEFFPEDFVGLRDKLARVYNKWQYRLIARKAKRIVTVSLFSKKQIAETYHINPERVRVIYSSWNHFSNISPDYTIFDKYPDLIKQQFYFSLGSISKRKNIKWIVKYALKRPDCLFALSGGNLPTAHDSELEYTESIHNIVLLGYLDDNKVKALMEKCKAFILPSYYEGFGLTPLEALSCGAKIIVARAASLPEIYGNTAHYIDPFSIEVDLDELLREPVEAPDRILEKYSYDRSARQVYALIKEMPARI